MRRILLPFGFYLLCFTLLWAAVVFCHYGAEAYLRPYGDIWRVIDASFRSYQGRSLLLALLGGALLFLLVSPRLLKRISPLKFAGAFAGGHAAAILLAFLVFYFAAKLKGLTTSSVLYASSSDKAMLFIPVLAIIFSAILAARLEQREKENPQGIPLRARLLLMGGILTVIIWLGTPWQRLHLSFLDEAEREAYAESLFGDAYPFARQRIMACNGVKEMLKEVKQVYLMPDEHYSTLYLRPDRKDMSQRKASLNFVIEGKEYRGQIWIQLIFEPKAWRKKPIEIEYMVFHPDTGQQPQGLIGNDVNHCE